MVTSEIVDYQKEILRKYHGSSLDFRRLQASQFSHFYSQKSTPSRPPKTQGTAPEQSRDALTFKVLGTFLALLSDRRPIVSPTRTEDFTNKNGKGQGYPICLCFIVTFLI